MSLLLEKQPEWGASHNGLDKNINKEKELIKIVSKLPGINIEKLQQDMNDPAIEKLIENDKQEGIRAGVNGTPTLFVNGKIIDPLSLDKMIEMIDSGLK